MRRSLLARVLALLPAAAPLACGGAASPAAPAPADPVELRPANVDARLVERAPVAFDALALPSDVGRVFASVDDDGDPLLVAADGRFFAVDAYGALSPLSRLPGEAAGADAPVTAMIERSPGETIAIVPSGALWYRGGWVERVELGSLLAGATARCAWGAETLWATGAGVYTTQGAGWLRLDREGAPVTNVTAMIPGPGGREAWVLGSDGALRRLRLGGTDGAPTVQWSDPVPGLLLDRVKSVAVHQGARYVARTGDLLRVTSDGTVQRIRIPGTFAGPYAMVSAGPWLWLAWDGDTDAAVGRFDGDHTLEMIGRGGPWRSPALAVDRSHGDVAVVTEGATATRVVVASFMVVTGITDGETVTAPGVDVRVDPASPSLVAGVDFSLDGVRVTSVAAAPYVWGPDGTPRRDLVNLAFGEHTVTVAVRYRDGSILREARRFSYASPLGRVPTYAADILPLYTSSCARCHSTGIARDLSTFATMSAQAELVAAEVQTRRMPPDLTIDSPTIQTVAAWVAGGTLER